jgi:hypothetical protein
MHSAASMLQSLSWPEPYRRLRLCCMQVGNVEMLNCYYAHADTEEGAQVRTLFSSFS